MRIVKLGDLVTVMNEREDNPSQSKYDHFVGLEHYDSGSVSITRWGSTEMLVSAMKVFHRGDILVARRNVYLKRASTVDFDGITSGDSIILRVNDERYKAIVPFVLNTDSFWDYADQHSDGSMSKRLAPKTMLEYEFTLPDDEEVERLSTLLWAMERTKTAYKNLIAKTDELVKSQFVEMFGTFPANEHGWPVGTIRDGVMDVRYGSSRKAAEGNNGQYPYLRMNNITYGGELDLTDVKTINIPDDELDKCSVRRGDVLFNRTNSRELVGKTCVYNRDEIMVLAGFVVRVRVNDRLLPEFLSAFMNTDFTKTLLLSMCKAAIGQANINATEFQNIGIYFPPIEHQQEFVQIKAQADKSKFAAQQALADLTATQKVLMRQYLG